MILFKVVDAVMRNWFRDWSLENESPDPGPGGDEAGRAAGR
jgi:hypothetical protein